MDYYSESYEPMDIDLSSISGQSVRDMDISYGDSADVKIYKTEDAAISTGNKTPDFTAETKDQNIKKYHIIKKKPAQSYRNIQIKVLFAVSVLLGTLTYHLFNIECSEELNIEVFSKILSSKVFGQSKATTTLIEALKLKVSSKILFFYGGTGVGKTYVSSLLLETMGSYSNVYHCIMPSFTTVISDDVMLGLTFCQTSLIIVDDLTSGDMNVEKQIKEVITKSEYLQKNLTVILIFNCHDTPDLFKNCDESFDSKLLAVFAEIKAHKIFVEFEPLTEEHLRLCVEREMGPGTLNKKNVHEILPYFNVTVDGCKGVHSKMKYLNVI